MNKYLTENPNYNINQQIKSEWWNVLNDKVAKNKSVIQVEFIYRDWKIYSNIFMFNFFFIEAFAQDAKIPLNYYAAYSEVRKQSKVAFYTRTTTGFILTPQS